MKKRFLSVDFMRGITVCFMIIANNPGDTRNVYRALIHSHWHGWTAVDFIFPLFLFLVGVSVSMAAHRGEAFDAKKKLWPRALRRAAILFLLGLIVNGFPFFHLETLRIPGVLQRIAVVYLAVLWLHQRLGNKAVVVVIAVILTGYWLLWSFVPVPGLGFPTLDYQYNLESWLDQIFMRGHLWEYDTTWDPEGILSTLPCIALGLLGTLAGAWVKAESGSGAWAAFLWGMALFLGGLAWDHWFPINKIITTSSFVLFVGGFSVMLLVLLHRHMDNRNVRPWMVPFLALGKNALFVYVLSELFTKVLYVTKLSWIGAGRKSLHFWLFDGIFVCVGDRYLASMAWALALAAVFASVAMVLDRRGIVIHL